MNTMLPYIFWIDQYFARRKLIELAFEKQAWCKMFTLENFNDLQFRYLDLKPIAVILEDLETIPEAEKNFLLNQNANIILVKKVQATNNISIKNLVKGEISYQLNPLELTDKIQKIISNFDLK